MSENFVYLFWHIRGGVTFNKIGQILYTPLRFSSFFAEQLRFCFSHLGLISKNSVAYPLNPLGPFLSDLVLYLILHFCPFFSQGQNWSIVFVHFLEEFEAKKLLLRLFELKLIVFSSLQVRRDWFAYAVLSALPWVGRELYEKKESELDR